jgi:hypothetical protein
MLVALLVSAVCVGIRELGITGFLVVAIVANGKICPCAKSWSEVY